MTFATLLPLGVIQLWHSINDGYFEARSLNFINEPGNAVLEWLRMPGDIVFIVGGVMPFVWITWLGVRYRIKATTHDVPMEALFVEAVPTGATVTGGAEPTSGYSSDYRSTGTGELGGDRPGGGV
jgi:nitric oxide reductase subunit B